MNVTINGRSVDLHSSAETLHALLSRENLLLPGTAVAVNNRVVPRSQWQDYVLPDGASIVVISAVCGG